MQKVFALAVIVCLVSAACVSTPPAPVEVPETQYNFYIPLVSKPNYPWIGVQTENGAYGQLDAIGYAWVRRWVRWDEIESTRGQYNWSVPDAKLTPLERFDVIAVLVTTPSWASYEPEYRCGPPKMEFSGDFVDYVIALTSRYSQIKAISFFNEPEAPVGPGGDMMGCFSNGAEYGRWLALIYDKIRFECPGVIVIAGDFAGLDSNFWHAAILEMGDKYDVIAYHSYPWTSQYWYRTLERADILNAAQSKPVWLTETSTVGDQTQANYLEWVMVNRYAHGIDVVIWYSLCGNRWPEGMSTSADMAEYCDGNWRPVFNVFQMWERGGL